MSSFTLDTDGDLDTTSNELTLNSGIESIRQHLQVRLRLFKGEYFLNTDVGVPYFDDVFVKRPNFVVIDNVFKTIVLDTAGVISILYFNFDFDSALRAFTLSLKVLTEEGILDFTTELDL